MTTRTSLLLSAALVLGAAPVVAADGPRPVVVQQVVVQQVEGCSQWVFSVQVPAAGVRRMVPPRWLFSRDVIGKAMLSYRMFRCERLVLNGRRLSDVVWSELGVRLLPPDGAPELHVDTHVDGHDYYMLFLHTPSRPLARGLAAIGVPAFVVPGMSYALTKTADGITVRSREGAPGRRYEVQMKTGPVTFPTPQDVGVRSWHEDSRGILRGDEHKPCIQGTLTDSSLHVDAGTLLARLMDAPAEPDGGKRATSATDPWLAFDSTTRFARVPPPTVTDGDPVHGISLPCATDLR
jgi:hypothetical protein